MDQEAEDPDEEEVEPIPPSPPPPPQPSNEEVATEELKREINRTIPAAPEVHQLGFDFVRRHDKRTVRLLSNSEDARTFPGRRIWFNYEFEEPCFIEEILIEVEDYTSFSDFDFAFVTVNGKREEYRLSPSDGEIRKVINQFATEIAFRPPRRRVADGQINSVTIFGFAQSEASKFGEFANLLTERRTAVLGEFTKKEQEVLKKLVQLKGLESRRSEIEAAIQSGKKTLEDNRIELRSLKAQREETVARISTLENTISENEQKIEDQRNKIGEISDIRSNLARAIIEKRATLKTLTDNINLFPSELSDFVSQGSRDVKLYFLLALAPILVIAIMFGILIEGGVDLTTRITGEEDVNILAILVSRMPFVIVAVTIITACYYLARMFVLEMVRVNRQKLSLSKIGIIAKDISYSVENEMDLTDEEKYARRLTLKMDMLRDHLKDYLSKDFEPTLPKRSPFEQIKLPGFGANFDSQSDATGEVPARDEAESEGEDEQAVEDRRE